MIHILPPGKIYKDLQIEIVFTNLYYNSAVRMKSQGKTSTHQPRVLIEFKINRLFIRNPQILQGFNEHFLFSVKHGKVKKSTGSGQIRYRSVVKDGFFLIIL